MIIDLNTEQLQNVVQIARSANEAITEAANLLNSVVAHNDWQCPERDEINNNTAGNRSQALTLQTDAERLYANICYATDMFLSAEQEIISKFSTVDAPIASFLSKVPSAWAPMTSVDQPQGHNPAQAFNDSAWGIAQDALDGIAGATKKTVDVIPFGGIANAFKGE